MTVAVRSTVPRALAALALVMALLAGGCSFAGGPDDGTTTAPTATTTPATDATTATSTSRTSGAAGTGTSTTGSEADDGPPDIAVHNGSLPPGIDPGRAYARVRAVLGVNATAPAAVRIVNRSEFDEAVLVPRTPAFWRLLGVTAAEPNATVDVENGAVSPFGAVFLLLPANVTADRAATLLAHEFVHYAQFQRGRLVALNRRLGETTDDRFVRRATLEGLAVYATDAYVARYRPGGSPNSALYDRVEALFPAGSRQRYGVLAYTAGRDYLRARYDSPAAAWAVFESPPATAEQVLHAVEDPPRPLSVRVRAPGYRRDGRDVLGEAFVRTALANGLNASRARRAAAGWGNDTLVRLRDGAGDDRSFVWALRWDGPGEAAEFEAALRDALDARARPIGPDRWRLANRTVALARTGAVTLFVAGNASFADVEFTVDGDRVVVESGTGPGGENASVSRGATAPPPASAVPSRPRGPVPIRDRPAQPLSSRLPSP